MAMITLYGIKNCDTVKRARKTLDSANIEYKFHDMRADGLALSTIQNWLDTLGEDVINKRGTTWRKLDETEQARADSAAAQLLLEHPAMIKRPVMDKNGDLRLGFAAKDADDIVSWLQA